MPGVLKLEVASADDPARLELASDGSFLMKAPLRMGLFQDAAVLDGKIEITDKHALMNGSFRYAVEDQIALDLLVTSRLGPGPRYGLSGKGTLALAGHRLGAIKGRITEDAASVEGELHAKNWKVAGIHVPCQLHLRARGRISIKPRAQAEFRMEGEGGLALLGAGIQGRGSIQRAGGEMSARIEGRLFWQGHEWLGGQLAVGPQGLRIGGKTSLTVKLTPDNLVGTDLAHLFLTLDLSADFLLDAQGRMAEYRLNGGCTLGAKLPGEKGQVFPLAVREIDTAGTLDLAFTLVDIDGFELVPFDGIRIPTPVIQEETPPSPVRFGKISGAPAVSWAGTLVTLAGGVFPVVTPGSLNDDQVSRKVHLAYSVAFDEENTLSLDLPLQGKARVRLVWMNKKLAISLENGDEAPRLFYFEDFFNG